MNLYNGSASDVFKSQTGFILIEVFVSIIIISLMTLLCHQLLMVLNR